MGRGHGKTGEGEEEEKTGEGGVTAGTRGRQRHASCLRFKAFVGDRAGYGVSGVVHEDKDRRQILAAGSSLTDMADTAIKCQG